MATQLYIQMHMKDGVLKCGIHATLEEVQEAFGSKYEQTIRKARTRLTGLKQDTKLPLTDHATEVKKLVDATYAYLPNSLNDAYLLRHLLAVKS